MLILEKGDLTLKLHVLNKMCILFQSLLLSSFSEFSCLRINLNSLVRFLLTFPAHLCIPHVLPPTIPNQCVVPTLAFISWLLLGLCTGVPFPYSFSWRSSPLWSLSLGFSLVPQVAFLIYSSPLEFLYSWINVMPTRIPLILLALSWFNNFDLRGKGLFRIAMYILLVMFYPFLRLETIIIEL